MRKITIELYANNEYALDERLKQIKWAINDIVWPWPSNIDSSKTRTKKLTGRIDEDKEMLLSDYEYDKEDPTWSSCNPMVTTGRWKMEVVPDQDYVDFQKLEEL